MKNLVNVNVNNFEKRVKISHKNLEPKNKGYKFERKMARKFKNLLRDA